MESFLFFLLTIGIATAGGLIGFKLKLPAGVMLGAMLFTVIFNLLFEQAVFYPRIRVGIQVLAGSMIGSRMDIAQIRGMKRLLFPLLFLVIGMFIMNVAFGTLMYFFSSLDVATSLFATAPGGASDMAIIASDLGANPAYIAILQLSRLIIIFTCMPTLFKRIIAKLNAKEAAQKELERQAGTGISPGGEDVQKRPAPVFSLARMGGLLGSAATVGMAFYFMGIMAGAMIGGMVGGTLFCVWKGRIPFPVQLRVIMQIGSGAYIGMQVGRETIMSLGSLAVPIVIMFFGIFAFTFGTAYLIHKVTKLNLVTCLLASSPGGQQEMALLSEDLGADTPSVAIMQTARLMCVIAFFPTMLKVITGFF